MRAFSYALRMTDATVLYELRDGVALLTLNRPKRLNALVPEMQELWFDLLERAADDPDVRVIVVTGAGRGFCAGADLERLEGISGGDINPGEEAILSRAQTFPLTIPKPIIAALNGATAGLGLVQALMCDLRFAAAGAKLTTAFARRGLVAEHGMSWILPRLVGPSRALDLLLSGRVVLADEAATMGLVDRVYSPDQLLGETLAYARELVAHCSPSSMATMKQQVYTHLDAPLERALEESNELMLDSFRRPDLAEGVSSFQERRAPRFEGLGAAQRGGRFGGAKRSAPRGPVSQ
jgi:enoyl-CoA hydratase/carnithine racemase